MFYKYGERFFNNKQSFISFLRNIIFLSVSFPVNFWISSLKLKHLVSSIKISTSLWQETFIRKVSSADKVEFVTL